MRAQELTGILRDNLESMFPQASIDQSQNPASTSSTIFKITLSTAERLAANSVWQTLQKELKRLGHAKVELEYGKEPQKLGEIDIIARVGTDAEHCRMCIRSALEETPQKVQISTIEAPPRG